MPTTAASHSAHLASTTSSTGSFAQTGYTVVDVKHRLAPEHPFSAAFDEIEDVVNAAGNLALAVASSLRLFSTAKVNEESPFHAVVAFYPATDLSQPTTAKKQVAKSKIFDSKGRHERSDSPSYADPGRSPKNLLIITTEQDPFTIEGEKLAEEVRMEGHNVVCHWMEGSMHGWDKEAKRGSREWKAKEETYGYAADMLRIRESSCDPETK
ncbi:alpha/beta hydrolase [Aspergillus udagawae]|uniref:Alpha/beta hydrolase fold-3 domain-containing protein n=1 Tax=Aspergillus udagawae TaxID=91492 RepID=A0A8E0UU27_9EURO|nr:uncharacterized protein Aud_001712 [Aspergillus udagawae]GIC85872.1 hypothetical protein Aud_001712 [Aspergillus udagawae]